MALMGLDNLFAVNLRLGQGVTSDRSAARTCAVDTIVTKTTARGRKAMAQAHTVVRQFRDSSITRGRVMGSRPVVRGPMRLATQWNCDIPSVCGDRG